MKELSLLHSCKTNDPLFNEGAVVVALVQDNDPLFYEGAVVVALV